MVAWTSYQDNAANSDWIDQFQQGRRGVGRNWIDWRKSWKKLVCWNDNESLRGKNRMGGRRRPWNLWKSGTWTRAEGNRSGEGACQPLPSSGRPGVLSWENFWKYTCRLVQLSHFWRPVQQKMYNSVFNLDFGRSICQKWYGKSTLFRATFKSGMELTVPAVQVPRHLVIVPAYFDSVLPPLSTVTCSSSSLLCSLQPFLHVPHDSRA